MKKENRLKRSLEKDFTVPCSDSSVSMSGPLLILAESSDWTLESSTGSAAAQYHCLYCPEPSAARRAPETRLPVAAGNKQE